MASDDIVERVTDHFIRQIAWFEKLREDLGAIDDNLGDEQLDQLAQRQVKQAKGTLQLVEEFRLLTRDWRQATDIPEEQRNAVRQLARKAEALSLELQTLYEKAENRLAQERAAVKQARNALKRGKNFLGKYRVATDPSGGFMDREA